MNWIESHVGDPLYNLESTKIRLEETDKRLKASISITLFDRLIENRLRADGLKEDYQQEIGNVWDDIRKNKVDPLIFVEEIDLLIQRFEELINRFGSERVPYAGPECGMSGWPRYDIALEGLRRITKALDYYEINH